MKFKKPVKSGLSIIIVGCGKVGNALVRQLRKDVDIQRPEQRILIG